MISYEIFRGRAYTTGGEGESRRTELLFYPKVNGYVIIGGYAFDVIDGRAVADLTGLEDGDFAVRLYTDEEIINADGIRKRGRKTEPSPDDAALVIELGQALREAMREIDSIKRSIEYLRLKVDGTSVL